MGAFDPHAHHIYIDGSALKNPAGPGGCGGILEFPDDDEREPRKIFQKGYYSTTNNRMELRAAIFALEYIRENKSSLKATRFIIVTDSLYVHDNHKNAPYWKRAGWVGSAGQPIKNSDIWNDFCVAEGKTGVSVTIRWHKGKRNEILKEIDRLAKQAAKQPMNNDMGFKPGKVGRAMTEATGASSLFNARGQSATIQTYRKKIVGKSEYKIFFLLFSEEESKYIEKYHAYASPEVTVALHRLHCYRVNFNSEPKHPVIEVILEEVIKTT